MKTLYTGATLLAALALSLCYGQAEAKHLSPQEALQRVSSSEMKMIKGRNSVSPSLVYEATTKVDAAPAFYVFDTSDKDGFMILSADDALKPVLGYSDNGAFDPDNIPPALKWWLGEYQREIEFFYTQQAKGMVSISTGIESTTRTANAAISPITKTLWNQEKPYNEKCPYLKNESGNNTHTVTGCVATATAQVMKVYEWPAQPTGSVTYHWSAGDEDLTLDFSTVTLDWANMTDTYSDSSTAAQDEAVATLMQAVGYGVHMEYGLVLTGGSGAASIRIPQTLINNFGYSDNARYISRNTYASLGDWDQLVYDELAQGRPVLLGGFTKEGEGHEFVCDGYDGSGKFHINWGWGGMSDGYFTLDALDPPAMGAGGAASGFGFDYSQDAVIGIMKPGTTTNPVDPFIQASGNVAATLSTSQLSISFTDGKNYNGLTNQNFSELSITRGVKLVAPNDSVSYIFESAPITMHGMGENLSYAIYQGYSVPFDPNDMAKGTYTVSPVVKYDDQIFSVYPENNDYKSSTTFTLSDTPVTDVEAIKVTQFFPEGDLIPGQTTNFYIVVENTGNVTYDKGVHIYFKSNDGATTERNFNLGGSIAVNGRLAGTLGLPIPSDMSLGFHLFDCGNYEGTIVSDEYHYLVGYPVTSITLETSDLNIAKGDSPVNLDATVLPDNAAIKTLEWSSSNPDVATVDESGLVTPKAIGTSTVTAKATDGSGIASECLVTVSAPTGVELVSNVVSSPVDILTVSGLRIASGIRDINTLRLPAGIYLVKSATETRKVIITR